MNWKKFFKTYNEFISLPVAIVLYFLFPWLYRLFDPNSGSFDAGYIHTIILAVIMIFTASGVAWFLLKWNFPKFYKHFDDEMEDEILNSPNFTSIWQNSSSLPLLLYLAYFFSLIFLQVLIIG